MKKFTKLFLGIPIIFGILFLMSGNALAQTCKANFTYSPGSPLNTIVFTPAINTSTTHYYWNFGDGITSLMKNPTHTYASPGTYWVCLKVIDSTNLLVPCMISWCDSVHVGNAPPPNCNAKYTFRAGNTLYSVVFTGPVGLSATTKYFWNFGDGGTATIPNPFHTYPGPGAYWACLTVSDSSNAGVCKNTYCDSIHIGNPPPPPPCDAHFTQKPGNTLNSVVFTPAPSSSVTRKYFWNFGDGTTSGQINPLHTYPGPGTYWACLTVSDSTNAGVCKGTWCDSVHVGNVILPPVCDPHFTHKAGTSLYSEVFTPSPNSSITRKYFWNFGDGTTSNQPNPYHTYPGPGSYWACLTVSDSTNAGVCKNTWCDSVKIGNPVNTCNAHYKYMFTNSLNGVSFTSPINPPGTTFFWNFGDGTTSTIPSPTHTFPAAGVYWVCLTVSDSLVCKTTWCDSIHINNLPPVCNAHYAVKPGSNIGTVGFAPAPNPPGTRYFWDFGDGTTSTLLNPMHTFPHAGAYWVCLSVVDSTINGVCSDKWCDSVRIGTIPPPNTSICNAHFKFYKPNLTYTVQFNAPLNPPGSVYNWNFGDGNFSNLPSPLHTYTSPGPYNVCLTVSLISLTDTCKNTWCTGVYPRNASGEAGLDGGATIIVYPNPMSEYATVTLTNTTSPVSFSIYDATGRVVYQKNNLGDGSFNIGNALSPGLYFYRATDESEVFSTGKLIVQ